jgi:ribonuclease D
MKTRDESLRSTREEERQVIADDKLHEYSITNSPDLRSVEQQQQQQLENFQSDYWSEQLNENRFVQEEYHQEQCPPLDEDDKQEQERQKRIEQLKFLLQQQMNQIKQKEQEVCFSRFIHLLKNESFSFSQKY